MLSSWLFQDPKPINCALPWNLFPVSPNSSHSCLQLLRNYTLHVLWQIQSKWRLNAFLHLRPQKPTDYAAAFFHPFLTHFMHFHTSVCCRSFLMLDIENKVQAFIHPRKIFRICPFDSSNNCWTGDILPYKQFGQLIEKKSLCFHDPKTWPACIIVRQNSVLWTTRGTIVIFSWTANKVCIKYD